MKIKNIYVDIGRTPTYDIEVPYVHNYILEDGTLTHNSSISAGTTNAVYPIRDFDLNKTNDNMVLNYVSPESTKLKNKYEIAWDIDTHDLIKCYAIMQKWIDQGISVDLYRKVQGSEKVGTTEMINIYLDMVKYGLKSRYYLNSLTGKGTINEQDADDCESCKL